MYPTKPPRMTMMGQRSSSDIRPGIDRMYTKEEATALQKGKIGGGDDSGAHYDPEVMNQIIDELYDNGSLRDTPYDSYDFRERVGRILGPKANVEKGGEFPDERTINDAVNKAKRGYTPPTGLKPRMTMMGGRRY